MNFEGVKSWLGRQRTRQVRIRWMTALLGMALVPAALVANAMVMLFVCVILTQGQGEGFCLLATSVMLALSFVVNHFVSRNREPERYYHDEPDLSLTGRAIARQRFRIKVLLWVIFAGPRLVAWSIFSFREIGRLRRLDCHAGAAVLFVLFYKGKRLSYPQLQQELDWLDVEGTVPLLNWIPGVLYFQSEPPAVSLTEDLREAIRSDATP
jgi:hypothetical protein